MARRLPRLALAPVLLALLVPATALGQADDDEWLAQCRRDDDERVRHCEVRVERLPAGGTLRVDATPNGGVEVRSWDRDEIEVHARIGVRAASESAARAIAEQIRISFDRAGVEADGPQPDRRESWYVSYLVYVPARADLDLESTNGPVGITGVTGRVIARTVNGPLSLRDMGGDVEARTTNGPLNVSLSGERWNGEGLDAETSNGPLTVRIPEGYSANLETGTINGPMHTDVPLTVTMLGRRSSRIETVLGDGGPPIRVVTRNGPVSIRRR